MLIFFWGVIRFKTIGRVKIKPVATPNVGCNNTRQSQLARDFSAKRSPFSVRERKSSKRLAFAVATHNDLAMETGG